MRVGRKTWIGFGALVALAVLAGMAWRDLSAVQPARSTRLLAWEAGSAPAQEHGAALFSYGDFGAIDLDTLETSALPWPVLAASLALHEAQGRHGLVDWPLVERAFRRFGFLYPETLAGLSNTVPVQGAPLGFSIGTLTRTVPPLRMDVLNIGCAACHAGPVYGADGMPDLAKAVPGMPNTSLDLEAFTAAAMRRSSARSRTCRA